MEHLATRLNICIERPGNLVSASEAGFRNTPVDRIVVPGLSWYTLPQPVQRVAATVVVVVVVVVMVVMVIITRRGLSRSRSSRRLSRPRSSRRLSWSRSSRRLSWCQSECE